MNSACLCNNLKLRGLIQRDAEAMAARVTKDNGVADQLWFAMQHVPNPLNPPINPLTPKPLIPKPLNPKHPKPSKP